MQYEKKQFFNTKTSRILRYSSWLQRGERIKSHFAIAVYYIDENLNAIKGQHRKLHTNYFSTISDVY